MEKVDLKEKFRTFLTDSKQKLLSPTTERDDDGGSSNLLSSANIMRLDRGDWTDSDREVSQMQGGDPLADQEVLDSLDTLYFSEDSDPSLHCLNLLGEQLGNIEVINQSRKNLMMQLTTVSRRVFSLILEKQGDCAKELEAIMEVETALLSSLSTCMSGRDGLARAQTQFVNCSLGILARHRRKQQVSGLLDNLETIRTLSLTQDRLQELLAEENYPQAISLLLECIKVSSTYRHFTAINQLSSKLADTLVMAEEQLDLALSRQCTNFQSDTYSRLHQAYSLLGKTQTSADQVLMHFTTAIHNNSWAVVYGHVCLMGPCPRPPPYPELCREVAVVSFLPCLADLLRSLWTVMLSYHRLVQWHRHNQGNDEESDLVSQYCRNKLEAGVSRVWQDVQTKVKQYVLASDLSQFSIDHFLHFLDLLHRLITVGQEFSGTCSSALLQDSLVKQCRAYFSTYHVTRMDELKVHLENEAWTLCPVKHDFNFRLLAEFSHLSTLKSPTKSLSGSFLKRFSNGNKDESPFDELCQESLEEDILMVGDADRNSDDSEDELSAEQMQELLEENKDSGRTLTGLSSVPAPSRPPVAKATGLNISNTAIMVLRLVGRYSHMMKVLAPIADTVWHGICQLFEYYIYSCNQFFAGSISDTDKSLYSKRLSSCLASIQDTVIQQDVSPGDQGGLTGTVKAAQLCPSVTLQDPELLTGLPERMVAVESAVFLAYQLCNLRSYLTSSLGDEVTQSLDNFYTSTVASACDLREPVYFTAIMSSINTEGIINMMGRVSWDLKEVSTQHSGYVEHLLQELSVFQKRLNKVASIVPVSKELEIILWQQAIKVATNCFVEGFAGAKKCSNEGRALMQLDFRQFVIQAELLSGLKPLPTQELVTVYIKAYYIQEAELEEWVEKHPEYTPSQLRAVVTAVTNSNNSKTKQKLNNLINDLSGRIRR